MKKKNKKRGNSRFSLSLLMSALVFFVLVWAIAIASLAVWLLVEFGVIGIGSVENPTVGNVILFMAVISIVMGATIAIFIVRIPFRPINRWIDNLNRLADGDFNVRMKFGKPLAALPVLSEFEESFNKLAEELQNTELLRSDFINNFSHEFKTPIVSIAGFAKLLKKGKLSEEERMQYLNAIEEESLRLSYMATNVLELTKVENQTILSDVSRFNLSEQIRSAVLLLEEKWAKKKIELHLDFDEYSVEGNEELLKQVWINLIDNAVKFAPAYGTVKVDIEQIEQGIRVRVGNTGSFIPKEKRERVFNKFYQADESHSSVGNGIGLAIVKKIVELHKGKVSVVCERDITAFEVELPQYTGKIREGK